MNKGDLAVSAGLDFGWDYGFAVGIEYMFARVDIANAIPITFGIAAEAGAGFFYSTNFTVVGLVTAHISPGFISDLPRWIKNFDFFSGMGLGFGAGTNVGLGMGSAGGVAYYFKPNLALYSSVIYAHYYANDGGNSGFGSLGLIFKL